MTPQVVLRDGNSSRRWCCKLSYETTNRVGNQAAVELAWCRNQSGHDAAWKTFVVSYCFHSSSIPQECGSGIWCHYKDIRRHGSRSCSLMSSIMKELLIVSSITKRRHGSCSCSSMSSIMKELLIVSSIILISWHGSRNWDFDLIQLEGEQYTAQWDGD
jgi:hypothetical protein